MAGLREWRQQPQYPVEAGPEWRLAFNAATSPQFTDSKGVLWSLRAGSDDWRNREKICLPPHGIAFRSEEFYGGGDDGITALHNAGSAYLWPREQGTFVILGRAATAFAYQVALGATNCNFMRADVDSAWFTVGNSLWDTGVAWSTVMDGSAAVAVTWGAFGRRLYKGGVLLASTSSAPGASAHSGTLNLGGDGMRYWMCGISADVLDAPALSVNPWQIFRPRNARLYSFPSGGGETKSVSDSGAGADTIAQLAVALGLTDTGSGTEVLPGAAAALGVADTGSAADLLSALSAALAVTDSATAVDALSALAAALAVSESAAAADAVSIITEALFQITDTGTASDALAGIVAQLALADTAAGVDAIAGVSTSLVLSDSGIGVDATPIIAALLALAETASGADVIAVLTETLKQIADSGSAADGVSLTASISLADTATGADTLLAITALLTLADSGAGIDVAARFDAAVRIVKLVFSFRRRHAEFRFARRTMHFQLAA